MSDYEFLALQSQSGRFTWVSAALFLTGLLLLVARTSAIIWIAMLGGAAFFHFVILRPVRARYSDEVLRRKVVAARTLNGIR